MARATDRGWTLEAVRQVERDFRRSADTHLLRVDLPATPGVHLYLKDESTHPSGSLKHRLARSLFLYGLCNGWIGAGTTIVEASSGSTAISEAYFARLLGLPFIAVVPRATAQAKLAQIAFYGGRCHFVDRPTEVYDAAAGLARETGGHYMDQFTYAERATDWRGNNNIAESIFHQLGAERYPVPRWIVTGAGTGGTSATIGRYLRYQGYATGLCVVDPEHSVFYDYFLTGDNALRGTRGSAVEGIGRPRVEPSFIPQLVDHMLRIPDGATFATMRVLEGLVGRRYGGSTGTNVCGALILAHAMAAAGEGGSIVALAGDAGDRYLDTYYDDAWLRHQGYDTGPYREALGDFCRRGVWDGPLRALSDPAGATAPGAPAAGPPRSTAPTR